VTRPAPLTASAVAARSAAIAPALGEHLEPTPLVRFDTLSKRIASD
jgi:hypothetical protein